MKPINLVYKETEDKLVEVINNSGLMAFALKSIIDKILPQLNQLEQTQLVEAQKQYEQELKKNDKDS